MMLILLLISLFSETNFKSFIQTNYASEKQLVQYVNSHSESNFEQQFQSSFKNDQMLLSHPTLLLDSYEAYIESTNYVFSKNLLKNMLIHLKNSSDEISFNQIMYIQVLSHYLKSDAVPALTEFIGNEKLQTICLSSLSIATGMQYQSLESISDLSKFEL